MKKGYGKKSVSLNRLAEKLKKMIKIAIKG
jgi:hypothetical protein